MTGLQNSLREESLFHLLGTMVGMIEVTARRGDLEDIGMAVSLALTIVLIYVFVTVDRWLTVYVDAWWSGMFGLGRVCWSTSRSTLRRLGF